jgi:ribonucleoside-diphosphate reductase alpha chain
MFSGKIKKRDGRIVDFDADRIKSAVHKAFLAVELSDGTKAEKVTHTVVKQLQEEFEDKTPSVEDVQDAVIEVLRKDGYETVALAYEDFRKKKEELRKFRGLIGLQPKLTVNAMEVLKARYLLRDETGTA